MSPIQPYIDIMLLINNMLHCEGMRQLGPLVRWLDWCAHSTKT